MKQMYKVLAKDMKPPIQKYCVKYHLKKWYHCENFDMSDKECAPGYYVIPVSELIHYHKPWNGTKVLEARVKGKERIFSPSKQRYEYMILDEILTDDQIIKLCKEAEPELGYKLSEALYPVNPLKLPNREVIDDDIDLLAKWYSVGDSVRSSVRSSVGDSVRSSVGDSVRSSVRSSVRDSVRSSVRDSVWDSVWDSVRASVWDSVWDSVGDSVWDSVRASVWDSVMAYIGSLFPNIMKWGYIDHELGVYPFQPAVDLWYRGLVPSYDGKLWRLHSGGKAEVVWTEPSKGWLKMEENNG